ncbi:hypothetical protein [Fusobacterium necrogenes]|uniref:hypothetical protein n=1 Tax=Fusobacterium necrogenes TaxID=858 RepID=UPI00255CCF8B|nr:hypothetical protein [Fusobacterium necrogenes]
MNLWNSNQEDLTTKIGRGEKITKNGVYEFEIKEAYLTNSGSSKAVGITLNFENSEGYARVTLWHKKGDGTDNKFAQKLLNRMVYLLKLKVENLKTEVKKVKAYSGEEISRTYITNLAGKEIGVILQVKKDGDNINYEVKDFFDIKTEKTTDEILNKTDATDVKFYREKFGATTQPEVTEKEDSVDDEEEFPF